MATALGIPFKRLPIPFPERCSCFVSALAKIEHSLFRRGGRPHVIVFQEKLRHLLAVKSLLRPYMLFTESGGSRSRIRIQCGMRKVAVARPKSATDHFVRISLLRDGVRIFSYRRRPA